MPAKPGEAASLPVHSSQALVRHGARGGRGPVPWAGLLPALRPGAAPPRGVGFLSTWHTRYRQGLAESVRAQGEWSESPGSGLSPAADWLRRPGQNSARLCLSCTRSEDGGGQAPPAPGVRFCSAHWLNFPVQRADMATWA